MTGLLATDALLAALRWDPHIKGALFVSIAVVTLMGSVYLLLATNTGARLGFVLALTGLFGWMTIMGAVWWVFGIGYKGTEPSWKVQELVTGELSQSTLPVARTFPGGWIKMPQGDPALAEAESAADTALAPSSGEGEGGHSSEGGGGGVSETAGRFKPPFKSKEEYKMVDAFRRGGEDYFLSLRHRPHYAVVQVKAASTDKEGGGQPTAPADQSTEEGPVAAGSGSPATPSPESPGVVNVVMLRDLGNLRMPPFLVTLASAIVFGVCCYSLHQRDKSARASLSQVT